MALLRDPSSLTHSFTQIWHAFRIEILFALWKEKNIVLFSHSSIDMQVFLYAKTCICNNVMLQIQVQANKVTIEVACL